MIELGLRKSTGIEDKGSLAYLIYLLSHGYNLRIVINMMDLNHSRLRPLTDRFYDGQVNIDADAEITRSASLTLWDADRTLAIDTKTPGAGALYYDKMIQMHYCVWRTGDLKSIDIPIFTGPITSFKRSGAFVNVDMMGKEFLSMNPLWTTWSRGSGGNKTKAIRSLMSAAGEAKMSHVTTKAKLPKKIQLVKESIPWTEAKKISNSMGKQLFYDGRGVNRMRAGKAKRVFTFTDGDWGTVTGEPEITHDLSNARNKVWVKGGKPNGKKTKVSETATADSNHPLNPYRIGRKGIDGETKPRVLLEIIDDPNIKSSREAERVAKNRLDALLMEAMAVTFAHVPIPFLEEKDIVGIRMKDQYEFEFRLRQMTIPLVAGTEAAMGSNKNLALKRRK